MPGQRLIVGQPRTAIRSAAMMLDRLGHPAAAGHVTDAFASLWPGPTSAPATWGGTAITAEFTERLLRLL
ncbi:hypothetical protein [Streptomyces monashensis]|uniref:Uncharacterized protein n=1 Tax=Streptomyces monashensis TaxID=1678012 RepID=A0A1S2QC70_9ACTN|nr:hypothetical protein [Streptomyces monashensis]OIK03758.1 hypothetical protein BIV23_21165 [Streptomyces monashensis]